jgi:hypothetical protein
MFHLKLESLWDDVARLRADAGLQEPDWDFQLLSDEALEDMWLWHVANTVPEYADA